MQIIRRKSDNVVLYLFDDAALIQITNQGMTGSVNAIDILPETHDLLTGVDAPELFVGGVLAWDNGWQVTDQVAIDAAAAKQMADQQQKIADLCLSIDSKADAARLIIAGDPLRVVEYQRAEAEATAFAAADYTGTVPPTVASWAAAKQWTARESTDDILRASLAWNSALYAFRDIRLKGKEAVKAATDSTAAQTAAATAIAQINAVLAQVA